MLEFIQIECRKYIFQKKVCIVFLILCGFYIFQIVNMKCTNHLSFDLHYIVAQGEDVTTFVKGYTGERVVVDGQLEKKIQEEYRDYVDTYMQSEEKIRALLNERDFNETYESVYEHRYDYTYGGLVLDHENSDERQSSMNIYFQCYFTMLYNIDHLKEQVHSLFKHPYDPSYDYLTISQKETLAQLYQENVLDQPYVRGYALGWEMITSNMQFLPFMLGLCLLICFYGMFGTEKTKKTDVLILTCKEGKHQYVYGKLLTVWGITTILWIVFQVINMILCACLFGLEGADVSVYSSFFLSPYGYTYVSFYLHQLCISYLATICIAYLISLSSQLIRAIPTLILWIPLIIFTGFIEHATFSNLLDRILVLLPTQMMGAYFTYGKYVPYTILHHEVPLPILSYIVCIFILCGSILGLRYAMCHRQIKQ